VDSGQGAVERRKACEIRRGRGNEVHRVRRNEVHIEVILAQ